MTTQLNPNTMKHFSSFPKLLLFLFIILISILSKAQLAPNSYQLSKTLSVSGPNGYVQFGYINKSGKGTYGKIKVMAHNCDQLFISEYEFLGTYYASGDVDWIEILPKNSMDYNGIQNFALDVRLKSNTDVYELRLRRLNGGCTGETITLDIYIETNTGFTEQSIEGAATASSGGYLGNTAGWKFPVATTNFAKSTAGLFIDRLGNTSIGTTDNKGFKLAVEGSAIFKPKPGERVYIGDPGTGKTSLNLSVTAETNGYAVLESVESAGSSYGKLVINPFGGNVGVGTLYPTEKLSVDGNIRSRKVIVTQTGWSDYVFDLSYKLPSLDSVAAFVQENKHLPEVPSAATVIKEGLDVGEMQKLLLQKIEELTLYVIGLKKNDDKLQEENINLKKEIEKLKNK
ncbi:MAG: hypothetical protein J0I41_11980 [Filimonas sp.]|nr:hypothetical protein [Filimonas sp.]